jgi:CO/xanthine dehydrogenase Mo-binding subunit
MTTRYFGQPVPRNEDPRLLTGRALFVDDVELPGMLHAAFVRSPHAHARIRKVDVSAALGREGVIAVYTAADLGDYWKPGPLLVPPPPIEGAVFNERCQVPLAKDKVRHAGEPVALVIAESRYLAEDALADVEVDYEPLPAVVDLERAVAPDAPRVHDEVPGNVAAHVRQARGNYAEAAKRAHLVIRRRFVYDRGTSSPIETRGVVAQWDAKADKLTVWDTTQAPVVIRDGLAAMLGLSERQVRVVAPFIGGGFGPKIMMFYPEEVLVPWAAMQLGRPVKWIEDRAEHFLATTHERSQIHDAEMALTADGRILGIRDVFLHDTGAYDPYGLTVPINSQCTLLSLYVVPHYDSTFTAVFTTLPIVTPYRGAGRQHGIFVMERLLDIAARELGMDRNEIRRRNFIPPDAFPYKNHIIYQDFTPLEYDSGNYAPMLERLLEMIDYERFVREEQPRLRAQGKRIGIGVVCYVEGTGIGPYEGAKVQVQASGKVSVATGIGTQGQGHYTAFAQIVADQVGVDVSDGHRRHRPVLLGRRHLREPRRGGGGQRRPRGRQGSAAEDPAHRRRAFRVRRGGPRNRERRGLGGGRARPRRQARDAGGTCQSHARRGRARHGARPRGDALLRSADRRHRERRACHDRGSGSRYADDRDQALRRGARLRHGDQSADPRRSDPRRRGAGNRQRVLRAAGIRCRRAASQRLARRLPAAYRPRRAAHGARPHGDALPAQPARRQGRGRGRRDPGRRPFRSSAGGCSWC